MQRVTQLDAKDLDTALGFAVAVACLATVMTCGHKPPVVLKYAASAPSSSTPARPVPTASSSNAVLPNARPVAELRRKSLETFRAELRQLKDKQRDKPLRILWLGDSHTAGVTWPGSVEQALLQQVPSGGPGFLPLGLSLQRQHGARVFSDPSFEIAPHPPAKRSIEDDGVFGLAGFRATSREKSLEIIVKFDTAAQTEYACQLLYRYQRPSDRLVVNYSGKETQVRESPGVSFPHGIRAFQFKAPVQTPLQIRTAHGNPELFGLIAETANPGLIIDVLGINGARFATPLAWNEESWKSLVAYRQPALAVIAYGTNEVFDEVRPDRYQSEIERLLERIRAAVPGIECLLAGPTDVGRGGPTAQLRVRAIDEMERRVAEQQGCAYFSPYVTMGGAASFVDWVHAAPSLATVDGVHLTPAGYRRLGAQMAELLLNGDASEPPITASVP